MWFKKEKNNCKEGIFMEGVLRAMKDLDFDKMLKDIEEDRKEIVKCNECKHLIYKEDAQAIENRSFGDMDDIYFCDKHNKSCDFVRDSIEHRGGIDDIIRKYYKELEVSEDGTPIGFTKIKNK